jgi:hypothetical protein
LFTALIYIAEFLIAVLFLFGLYRMVTAMREESDKPINTSAAQCTVQSREREMSVSTLRQTCIGNTFQEIKHKPQKPATLCKKQVLNDYIGDFF